MYVTVTLAAQPAWLFYPTISQCIFLAMPLSKALSTPNVSAQVKGPVCAVSSDVGAFTVYHVTTLMPEAPCDPSPGHVLRRQSPLRSLQGQGPVDETVKRVEMLSQGGKDAGHRINRGAQRPLSHTDSEPPNTGPTLLEMPEDLKIDCLVNIFTSHLQQHLEKGSRKKMQFLWPIQQKGQMSS